MKFGELPIEDAEGSILGHSVRLARGVLKKGATLDRADIQRLRQDDVQTVVAARLEAGDVAENEAAARIARVIAGPGIRQAEAFTGRANMFAECDGVLVADPGGVIELNSIHEAMTVATLAPHARVGSGQMVATVKIIPFAVSEDRVEELESRARANALRLSVAPFRSRPVGLLLTRLERDRAKVVRKRQDAIAARVGALGGALVEVRECAHEAAAVARTMQEMRGRGCDLLLIFGASAIADRADIVPAGLERAGGRIVHLGMPVDPGNLLLYGVLSGAAVVGVPGCASSLKVNGFDLVLERVFADLRLGRDEIIAMAPGGLLTEIASRPQPREKRRRGGA